jgi:iron complex outermembrane receptor protein
MRKVFLPCVLTVSALVPAALAQEPSGQGGSTTVLDTIVVTAGRSERSISTVVQSVQVIGREEIERAMTGSPDAADLVARLVPGYAPRNQTISGGSETFRGRSVLIMVDGVPRNTPLRDVSRILSMIDLNSVERIEVVNGASSLYGAGATGGTINFITRRGQSETPRVTVRTGARAHTRNVGKSRAPEGSVDVEGRSGNFDYFFSGSGSLTRRTYDGWGNEMASDAMLGQGGGDRTGLGNLFGTVGYEDGPRRFEASLNWTYAQQKPDWFTDYAADPVSPDFADPYFGKPLMENSTYLTGRYTDDAFALGRLEVKSFYNRIEKRAPFNKLSAVNSMVYYSGNPLNPTADFNQTTLASDRLGLNATVNTPLDRFVEGATMTWGADYAFDDTDQKLTNGFDAIAPMRQHSLAAFAQVEIPVTERLRLQGGARFDQFFLDVKDFRRPDAVVYPATSLAHLYPGIDVLGGSFDYGSWSFNAGGVFDITRELQLFGNFSQGYSLTDIGGFTRRAGTNSLAEICDAYGSIAAAYGCTGVPDFTISYADIAPSPQLVDTYEAGLRGDWGDVRGGVSAYLSTSDEGVSYDIAANRVSQQKERIWGVELNAEYDIDARFTVGGVLGYVEGRYDANRDGTIGSDEYLPNNRIPSNWTGLAYVNASLGGGFRARGEVEFFSGRDRIPGQKLDGEAFLNIALWKEFADGSELSLAVRNVFDTSYINPTASATRGVPVPGLGRTIFASYKKTF